MDDFYKAIFGVVAAAFGLVGFVMKVNQNNAGKFKDLHNRVDGVKDNYVRRDDLDNRLRALEKGQDELSVKVDRLLERK